MWNLRRRLFTLVSALTLVAGVGAAVMPSLALAAPRVSEIRIGIHPGKLRVVLESNAKLPVSAFTLAAPYRVVLDLPDVEWGIDATGGEKATSFITSYRFGHFAPGKSRVVFDLKSPAVVDRAFHLPPRGKAPWRLVVDLKPVEAAEFERRAQPPPRSDKARPSQAAVFMPMPRPRPQGKAPKKVVVIDPGHGGIDPGALGRKGIHEKRITLAMARQLRDAMVARGRYQVVMTRDRDIFVRLRERIAMARAAGADLFISLHADSIKNRRVRGASVYTLSEKASDREAADLAAKENKSDLIAGVDLTGESTEVANILIDLAQRETMNHSAAFASTLVGEMRKKAKFLKKSHRFAGFAVLKAPDVPSVLIEMGYLSHAGDERRLLNPAYRATMAGAIADAVDRYFDRRAQNP
ncbi:MAG: N-acetylmuramoyl-L-alanine amidase [Alphaproteobacteria bacterium]|jgi:N-acetylmuramoyl-L-alanine amidase